MLKKSQNLENHMNKKSESFKTLMIRKYQNLEHNSIPKTNKLINQTF